MLEIKLRQQQRDSITPAEYQARFPQLDAQWLDAVLATPHLVPVRTPAGADGIRPVAPNATSHERVQLNGYKILGELGRGGMGIVYQARHVKLDRPAALKMLLAGPHASAAELARFQKEAEAIARLQHPNIIQIYEVGEHDGLPFFSLEYCPGGNLDKKLRGTLLSPKEAAALVEGLAGAIQAAHARQIIHRDLKPANVLLAEDGTPKVTDFGLAKTLIVTAQTASGAVMGTPSYMAPEQTRGQQVGPAADVYALGAVLYECLTGRPPFRAATAVDTVLQVLSEEPVSPRLLTARPRSSFRPQLSRNTGSPGTGQTRLASVGSGLATLTIGGQAVFGQSQDCLYFCSAVGETMIEADFPIVPGYRQELARCHNNVGNLLAELGKRSEAEVELRHALELHAKLTADFPSVPQHRQELARNHYNLGLLLMGLGKRQEAEAENRRSVEVREQLVADFPTVPQHRQASAHSLSNLGILLRDQGSHPQAEAAYQRALALSVRGIVGYAESARSARGAGRAGPGRAFRAQ